LFADCQRAHGAEKIYSIESKLFWNAHAMDRLRSNPGTTFRASPGMLYFLQRMVIIHWMRAAIITMLGFWIRLRNPSTALARQNEAESLQAFRPALDALEQCGYAPLPELLTDAQVDEMHAFLCDKRVVDRRDPGRTHSTAELPAGIRLADYTMTDILACPHVLRLANDPRLLQLATDYIGCKPTISAILLRWSFPSDAPGAGVQAFHRDSDDWRFLKIFFYLTDVDEGAGPHVYVRGSHRMNSTLRLHTFCDDAIAATWGDAAIKVLGPRGFAFAADTYGVHKGMVPTTRPRLLLQIQYSLLPVFAYEYRPETYDGKLALDPYVNRLMLRSA
jgi:hypothetical protein